MVICYIFHNFAVLLLTYANKFPLMYLRLVMMSVILTLRTLLPLLSATPTSLPDDSRSIDMGTTRIGGAVQDQNGMIWVGTWSGLYCYDGYEMHNVRINSGDGTSIGGDHIRDIRLSPKGNIWCRTDNEIFEFDRASFSFKDLPPSQQSRIAPLMGKTWHGTKDGQNILWTADGSRLIKTMLHRHHPAKMLAATNGLCARSLFIDSSKRVWAGFKDCNAIKVYGADGSLLKTITMEFSPYCIYQMRNGDIWAGGKPGGLAKVGNGRSISTDAVYDLKEDAHGRLWIATFGEGIKCLANPKAQRPTLSPSLSGGYIKKLLITPSQHLIAATTDGLLIGSVKAANLKHISFKAVKRDGHNPRSLISNAVLDVKQDSKGYVYVCTESYGIDVIREENLFSDSPAFRHLGMGGSAMTNDVCGGGIALAGDSLLVVVGNNNVTFYNPQKDEVVNYARSFWGDSCVFSEVSPVRMANGSWLFCTLTGVLTATPHHLYSRGFVPKIFFTTLSVNGGSDVFTLLTDSLRLSADERNISLRFAAIDHINNKEIFYRSSFDGSAWSAATKSRSITLYDLTAGIHILRVQSTDGYGRWVDNSRTLVIAVAPHWYETWWAMALYALATISICTVVVYAIIYIRRIKKQHSELLHQLMEMIDREKKLSAIKIKEQTSAHIPVAPKGEETAEDKPHWVAASGAKPEDIRFLNRVKEYIEKNIGNASASIEEMADYAAVSRSTLSRRLQKLVGISAKQLFFEARMKRAYRLLADNATMHRSMDDIARMCGYDDTAYFKKVLKKRGLPTR